MGWRRKARTPRAMTAITWLLAVAILGTWGISMACLTVVTAQEIYDRLYELSYDFPREVSGYGRLEEFLDKSSPRYGDHRERPDVWENCLLSAISDSTNIQYYYIADYYGNGDGSGERSKLIRDMIYPVETAVLFYDGDGKLLHSSGEDILFFSYFTQAEWDAGVDTNSNLHHGWIDVSEGKDAADPAADPWGRLRESALDGHFRHIDLSAMRITGFFDVTELIPVTVHYVTDNEVWPVVERNEQFFIGPDSDEYTISAVDRTGELAWQLLFDRSGDHRGQPLVTIYVERPEMYQSKGTPLTYGGQRYESLTALTEELDFPAWASVARYSSQLREAGVFRLKELLVFSGRDYVDYQNFDYSAGGAPETEWTMVTAVRSRPLACAVSALRNLYIGTGLLGLGLLLAVRRSIKKRLVQPVAAVAEEMAGEWNELRRRSDTPPPWRETAALAAAYGEERDRRRMKDNELARLDTALAYAREAEQNRRQMTSHMARELKTPPGGDPQLRRGAAGAHCRGEAGEVYRRDPGGDGADGRHGAGDAGPQPPGGREGEAGPGRLLPGGPDGEHLCQAGQGGPGEGAGDHLFLPGGLHHHRRRGADCPGGGEFCRQRREVHAPGGTDPGEDPAGALPHGPPGGKRQRAPGPGGPGAGVGRLLPHGRGPQRRRHRPGAGHCPADRGAPRREVLGGEHPPGVAFSFSL